MAVDILGSLLPKVPGPQGVSLDPNTQALMSAGASMALRPASEFAADANKGVQQSAQSFMPSNEQSSQADARMGTGAGQMGFEQALKNKYGALAGRDVNKIMQANSLNAEMQKANMMNQYAKAYLGQQQAMTQNYEMLTQAYNQNEAARAQFINQLFGAANYGIGAKLGAKAAAKETVNEFNAGGAGIGGVNSRPSAFGEEMVP